MRALLALLVCCVLLAGCLSGSSVFGAEDASCHPGDATNRAVCPLLSGGEATVTLSFDDVTELSATSTNESVGFERKPVQYGWPSFSTGPSLYLESSPPQYRWDDPTDLTVTYTVRVREDVTPGEYRFTVGAETPSQDYRNGTTETVVVRVLGNESG